MAGREPGAKDISNKGRKFLTWLVDMPEPVAQLEPQLPALGTLYPFIPGTNLLLDSYATEPVSESPNSHTWVTGAYTNDRSARLDPREDSGAIGFKDWGWTIVEHTRSCPIVQVSPAFVDGTNEDFRTFSYDDMNVPFVETELVMQRSVVINQLTITQAFLVADANNTLFMIQGRPWLCKTVQNIPSLERGVTRVTYEFHSDRGSQFGKYSFNHLDNGSAIFVFGGSADPDFVYLGNNTGPTAPYVVIPGAPQDKLPNVLTGYFGQGQFLRSPFHELRVALRDGGKVSFVQSCNYRPGTPQQLAGLPGNPFDL